MKKATCFFCYAWAQDKRFNTLNFIKEKIEEHCDKQIEVILDKKAYKGNDDFDEKLEQLFSYDMIVIFFTPDLKRIILDSTDPANRDREVLKEYNIVLKRYRENPDSIFPVVLSGGKYESLPMEFSRKNVTTIKDFNIQPLPKRHQLHVPKDNKTEFNNFILRIINKTQYNFLNKSKEYTNTKDALDKLFTLTDTTDIPPSCLVQTDIYKFILNQKYYLVVGRKGSGKSTFINNFRDMGRDTFDRTYKQTIPLTAEKFQHENAFNILIKKHLNDANIIQSYDILTIFWQVYFALRCVLTIGLEIEIGNVDQQDGRYWIFNKIINKLKKKIGLSRGKRYKSFKGDAVSKDLFNAAVELVDEQFNKSLSMLNSDELTITAFSARMNSELILLGFFGQKDFERFLEAIRQCRKKILISLDGFDTHSEDFRANTMAMRGIVDEYELRMNYENMFFRTLIEVVTNFKNGRYNDHVMSVLSDYMHFCIVIPTDRYDQIMNRDRDSFKRNFCALTWDAYELLDLIVRRLEYLITVIKPGIEIDTSADLFDRMDNAIGFFPALPKTVSINIQGNRMQISLFNYLLRYSFWRPRDVISNLSCLMSFVVEVDTHEDDRVIVCNSSQKLTNEALKMAIKGNAKKIIREQFVEEYRNMFRNLNDVLREFENGNAIIEANEFKRKLSAITFDASYAYDLNDVDNKMLVLYQLGVIGLMFDKISAKKHNYANHICFSFNAGMTPFDDFIKNRYYRNHSANVVFNAIFFNELFLNLNTKELIGNWDRNYIEYIHRMKRTIQAL